MNSVWNLRKKMKMTQSEFAEYCGISVVSISRYETGGNISRKNAEKIAKACKVTVDSVLNLQESSGSENRMSSVFVLTSDEEQIISDYRKLIHRGRCRMRETLDEMLLIYSS
ncbi:MAG: helix-turn-helix transcriptional regulator [Lachnospiraceae bacterium]|nr:helix-turn-helix transcriptional regulator [Lachnospiraceae bacterium]